MPTTQNNQYTKIAYFEVTCPELLQSYFGVKYSATLSFCYRLNCVLLYQKIAKVLTPGASECDLIWKYSLSRGNEVKMRS